MSIDVAHQRRMFSGLARYTLLLMHRRTARDRQAPSAVTSLPYAVLGIRVNRRMRRSRLTEDELMRLSKVHAQLESTAVLIASSNMDDQKQLTEQLALGLAYDVSMFATAMASIADQAREVKSPMLVLAYRAAARAFHQARLLRADLMALAARLWLLALMLRKLAALEPAVLTLDHEWPAATARLDLPACARLIRTVAPTRGPNDRTEARLLHAPGSVTLAA